MKHKHIFIDSETLELSVETPKTQKNVPNPVILRSYPEAVEFKKFKFECVNECDEKWGTEIFGTDEKDAIKTFRMLYPYDKILTVTE